MAGSQMSDVRCQGSGPAAGGAPPRRIQRKRTKGWRMPANTEYVGRPTKYANQFIVGREIVRDRMEPGGGVKSIYVVDAAHAVQLYRRFLPLHLRIAARIDLRGKNLACWCPPGQPCHVDVLLAVANGRA